MNASPHAHTYDSNKKETKQSYTHANACKIMKQISIYISTQIKALEKNKYTRPHYRELNNITPLFEKN